MVAVAITNRPPEYVISNMKRLTRYEKTQNQMLICSSIFPQLFTGKFDFQKKKKFLGRFLADKGYFFD